MKFNKKDLKTLTNIIASRRDVRGNNFINKKISSKKLDIILQSALNAPSVGYSQPWQFIVVDEEKKDLTDRQIMRITYATTEFHIINSTYFYYVGLKNQSIEALKKIDPFGPIQKDTAQLLSYFYNIGAGGIITKGTSKDISQQEFNYLMRCYILSQRYHYPFWEANSMQAISEHLQDEKMRDYLIEMYLNNEDKERNIVIIKEN